MSSPIEGERVRSGEYRAMVRPGESYFFRVDGDDVAAYPFYPDCGSLVDDRGQCRCVVGNEPATRGT